MIPLEILVTQLRKIFNYVQTGRGFIAKVIVLSKQVTVRFWSSRREIFSFRRDSWRRIPEVDFLMMSSDADKTTVADNKSIDRFLDPLSEELRRRGYSTAHLARPPASRFGLSTFSEAYSINRAYFWARFLDALSAQRQASDGLSHVFQLFRRALSRIKPKAIFTVGYLPVVGAVAQSLRIPLIEVLHSRGYLTDPRVWLTGGNPVLPRGVFSFDEVSSKTLRRAFSNVDVEIFDMEDFAYKFFISDSEKVAVPNFVQRPNFRVLVTLSWGFAGEDPRLVGKLSDGLLPNGLMDSVRDTRMTHFWTVRMHPVQVSSSGEPYRSQRAYLHRLAEENPNMSVDFGNKFSIYQALEKSNRHLTTMSMAVYEAAQMGVPSLALSKGIPCEDLFFNDLEAEGWVEKGDDCSKTILEWIAKSPSDWVNHGRKPRKKPKTIDYFLRHPLMNTGPGAIPRKRIN